MHPARWHECHRGKLATFERDGLFSTQWKDEQVAMLQTQLGQASSRWESDPGNKEAYDTMLRMQRFAFALETLGTPELKVRTPRRRGLH